MKIIIGSDHRGYLLKEAIKREFSEIEWIDVGTDNGDERVDYPVITQRACRLLLDGQAERGILICGSGVGVSMAANRFSGIYAALCWSPDVASVAREHDCANVLALSSDFVSEALSFEIVQAWLRAEFLGGRYQKRLEMLS